MQKIKKTYLHNLQPSVLTKRERMDSLKTYFGEADFSHYIFHRMEEFSYAKIMN